MRKIFLATAFLLISIISLSENYVDKDKSDQSIFVEINGGTKYHLFYNTGYSNGDMKSNIPFNVDIFIGLNVETKTGYLIGKAGFGVNPFNYTHYYQSSINGEWFDSSFNFKYTSYNHFLNIGYLYKLNNYISCGFNSGLVFIRSHDNGNKYKANAIHLGLNVESFLTEYLR